MWEVQLTVYMMNPSLNWNLNIYWPGQVHGKKNNFKLLSANKNPNLYFSCHAAI